MTFRSGLQLRPLIWWTRTSFPERTPRGGDPGDGQVGYTMITYKWIQLSRNMFDFVIRLQEFYLIFYRICNTLTLNCVANFVLKTYLQMLISRNITRYYIFIDKLKKTQALCPSSVEFAPNFDSIFSIWLFTKESEFLQN